MTDYADLTLAKPPPRYARKPSRRWNISRRFWSALIRTTPTTTPSAPDARYRPAAGEAGRSRDYGRHLAGPYGVPYGLKDIIDVAGVPTTAHSKILADNLARTDAVVTAICTAPLAASWWASWPPTSLPWAGRPLICPGRRRVMPGIGITSPAGPPAAPARPWRRSCARRPGHGHRRVGPQPASMWHYWPETDLRPGQPPRRHPAVVFPGSCGAYDAHGDRQRPLTSTSLPGMTLPTRRVLGRRSWTSRRILRKASRG